MEPITIFMICAVAITVCVVACTLKYINGKERA
jgi:hypothetical protein